MWFSLNTDLHNTSVSGIKFICTWSIRENFKTHLRTNVRQHKAASHARNTNPHNVNWQAGARCLAFTVRHRVNETETDKKNYINILISLVVFSFLLPKEVFSLVLGRGTLLRRLLLGIPAGRRGFLLHKINI